MRKSISSRFYIIPKSISCRFDHNFFSELRLAKMRFPFESQVGLKPSFNHHFFRMTVFPIGEGNFF